MTCAITIARKGSTRIAHKNAALLCGKPLTYWTLIAAQCSHLVDRNILATDDEELADLAYGMGIEVFWRTDVKNDDPGWVAFLQVMDWLETSGQAPTLYVTLLPTSPMKLPHDIDRGIRRYQEGDAPNVMWGSLKREHTPMHALTDLKGDIKFTVTCLFDKGFHFLEMSGIGGICNGPMYIRLTQVAAYKEGMVQAWYGMQGVVLINRWQLCEIDIPEDLEDAELIMQHRIIKPYGADCYQRYRDGAWTPPPDPDIRLTHGYDAKEMFR